MGRSISDVMLLYSVFSGAWFVNVHAGTLCLMFYIWEQYTLAFLLFVKSKIKDGEVRELLLIHGPRRCFQLFPIFGHFCNVERLTCSGSMKGIYFLFLAAITWYLIQPFWRSLLPSNSKQVPLSRGLSPIVAVTSICETNGSLVGKCNFEMFGTFRWKIYWLGTWNVGYQMESKIEGLLLVWRVNCSGWGHILQVEKNGRKKKLCRSLRKHAD